MPISFHTYHGGGCAVPARGSRRTKAALQVAKAWGTELGKHGKDVLSKRNKENADAFALEMQR